MFPKRKETDYAQFLGRVAKFDDVPMKTKVNLANFKAYKAYVSDVAAYLRGFFEVFSIFSFVLGFIKSNPVFVASARTRWWT